MDSDYFNADYFTRGVESNKSGYDKYAFELDNDVFKKQATLLENILKLRGQSVLDVGCARGNLIYWLRKLGIRAWGLDISEWCLKNSHIKDCHILGDIQEETPLKDGLFDVVVSFETLEHLSKPHDAMKNIYNSLLYGGTLFCTIHTKNRLTSEDISHTDRTEQEWREILGSYFKRNIRLEDIAKKTQLVKDYSWDVFIYEKPFVSSLDKEIKK